MATPEYTLEELILIRTSIGAELDILDDELDDPKNGPTNLIVSRAAMLNKHASLLALLEKTHKKIRSHHVTIRSLPKVKAKAKESANG